MILGKDSYIDEPVIIQEDDSTMNNSNETLGNEIEEEVEEKNIENENDDKNVASDEHSSEDELESSRQSQCEELFYDDEDNIEKDLKYESLFDLSGNSGKKVIVPTMEIPDHDSLQLEIQQDSREAELLIQLKHLSARIEAQDTLLAELKEENTVLKIQNQSLVDSLNKVSNKNNLFRKSSKEFQSLEPQVVHVKENILYINCQ